MAKVMPLDGEPAEKINKYSRLPDSEIAEVAEELEMAVLF